MLFQVYWLLLQRHVNSVAKIGNLSHEVAELSQQIFHKVQMEIPSRDSIYYREQFIQS